MKNALITGGNGFIGKELCSQLRQYDYDLTITTQIGMSNSGEKSIYTYDFFDDILKKKDFDLVYFFSGNPYPSFSENNPELDLTLTNIPLMNLLEAMKNNQSSASFWFASSVAVYGKTEKQKQSEDDICRPLSKYSVCKMMGEQTVRYFSRVYGLNTGSLRIFSTFGPSLRRQLIYDIYEKIKSGKNKIKLFGSVESARDFSFVSNQVDRILFLSKNYNPNGDIFNIGSGKLSKVVEVVEIIKRILKSDVPFEFNDNRSFDGISWVADTKKINDLGYDKKESIEEGLEKTIFGYENDSRI